MNPALVTELSRWRIARVRTLETSRLASRVVERARFDTYEQIARAARYFLTGLA